MASVSSDVEQLGRRPAQERRNEPKLVGVLRPLASEVRSASASSAWISASPPAPRGIRRTAATRPPAIAYADEARSPGRDDDTRAERTQPPELAQRLDRSLERSEPVAKARRVLEALLARESPELRPSGGIAASTSSDSWPSSARAAVWARSSP